MADIYLPIANASLCGRTYIHTYLQTGPITHMRRC